LSIFNLIGLIGLQVLNIQDNQVEELPYHLVRLTKLATLEIADNRITEPPAEISRLGIGNIIKYLTRKNQAYRINSLDLSSLGLEVCFTSTEVQILTLDYLLY
jgi:Leucine-rich repeat (LRR) protein